MTALKTDQHYCTSLPSMGILKRLWFSTKEGKLYDFKRSLQVINVIFLLFFQSAPANAQ